MKTSLFHWENSSVRVVFLGGLVALCLSTYPVIFMGKSFVSPGYGPPLLYSGLPLVPGYKSTDREKLSADHGSMPWQNLPYSRVQHQAVFDFGEFPLWNRYNSAGISLFGQGQSQILDPLHWIVVIGGGNGWAWDLKFLLAKLFFLLGIGACVLALSRSQLIAVSLIASAAFIGFFYFRFNHPIFFNLTYAPWVTFFYLLWIQRIRLRNSTNIPRPIIWALVGVFAASVFHLFAGTPKEGAILFAALHFSGLIGVGLASLAAGCMRRQMGVLVLLWGAIGLASAPHWLVFIDTLTTASTINDKPNCHFYSESLFQFVDTIFPWTHRRPWSEPVINVFIFLAASNALVGDRRLYKSAEFWMVLLPLVGLLGFAFGIVPNAICKRIPFIGEIHHINATFVTAAIPFAIFLAGLGLRQLILGIATSWGRAGRLAITIGLGFLLAYWAFPPYISDNRLFSAAGLLVSAGIVGTVCLFCAGILLYRKNRFYSGKAILFLFALFGLSHFYHGLHPETGWEELDELVINPTPRADLLEPSAAVTSLGYLLPDDMIHRTSSSVAVILELARLNGGHPDLINEYEGTLKDAIGRSSSRLMIQHHAANFLRGVGANRWLDNPARVLGIGTAPMPGFYSFLYLESLNGPDALWNPKYLEFLDAMGWEPKSGWGWLRVMNSDQVQQHEILLDVLNVRYLMSQRRIKDMRHMVSDYVRFSQRDLRGKNKGAGDLPRLSLRWLDVSTDRVSCHSQGQGLKDDGLIDNTFAVEIQIPERLLPVTIEALRLERKAPFGVNHTGGGNYVLGVALTENTPLINGPNGEINLRVDTPTFRALLFACADGHDLTDTEYHLRVAYPSGTRQIVKVADLDMQVWERKNAWPRAFFVNEVASYDTLETLAQFFQSSGGLPLAAVMDDAVILPVVTRQVVPARSYQITTNSTSFEVNAPSRGMVVLTETHVPKHVHVVVNGQKGKVITVNHAFRGVEIPDAGQYTIKFFYRPRLWYLSWIMSVIGLLIFGFCIYRVRLIDKSVRY